MKKSKNKKVMKRLRCIKCTHSQLIEIKRGKGAYPDKKYECQYEGVVFASTLACNRFERFFSKALGLEEYSEKELKTA